MPSTSTVPAVTLRPLLTATQLGHLLRSARKQLGMTQADVGARLGLSQNRVSHLEGHADELSVKQLLVWSAVVGLELSVGKRGAGDVSPAGSANGTVPEW